MFLVVLAKTVNAAGEETTSGLAGKIADFFDFIINQIPSWIAGFLVFVITIFVAKLAKAAVESRISDQVDEEHQEILVLAGRVTYFGTLVLGITIALKIAGIDLTTILAAVAFGIGFALRDLIMNFLSGVFILVGRQFTIGDFIKVGNTLGKVMEIQTRATILKAIDGTKVIVPNADIFTKQVVSYTTNPMRRVAVPLYVSYDTDLNYATKIALDVLKKHPKIMKKPAPSVLIQNYGDSTIDLSARFWVGTRDGWVKIKSDIMRQMLEAFTAAGIDVPYSITHIETSQDTAQYLKEADETAKKHMEELGLSKALEADAKQTAAAPAVPNENTAPQNNSAQPAQPQQLAAETVPVEPPATYADLDDIDQQG